MRALGLIDLITDHRGAGVRRAPLLADVRFVGPDRIIRDIAEAEATLPANLELPPGVFQSRAATAAFPAQKEIDRTMPNGLVIM